MSTSHEIKSGYKAITRRSSFSDRAKAYAEFHRHLQETEISVEDIEDASRQIPEVLDRAKDARSRKILVGATVEEMLRGSGIIVVGNHDGEILAANYGTDREGQDRVDTKYPGYQKVALRKMGQAAFLGSVDGVSILKEYRRLQDMLLEVGLTEEGQPPHHLGYASNLHLTVGASGMLPSERLADGLKNRLAPQLVMDYRRGWVNWEHDEFAGAIDLAVADQILYPVNAATSLNELAAYIKHYQSADLNVH